MLPTWIQSSSYLDPIIFSTWIQLCFFLPESNYVFYLDPIMLPTRILSSSYLDPIMQFLPGSNHVFYLDPIMFSTWIQSCFLPGSNKLFTWIIETREKNIPRLKAQGGRGEGCGTDGQTTKYVTTEKIRGYSKLTNLIY